MQIAAGFITLAVYGLLAVVAPSTIAVWLLWRSGGFVRVVATLGCFFIAVLAGLAFAGVNDLSHQWEEATLSFLLLLGVSFYALLGFSATALVLKRMLRLTRPSSGPPSAPVEL